MPAGHAWDLPCSRLRIIDCLGEILVSDDTGSLTDLPPREAAQVMGPKKIPFVRGKVRERLIVFGDWLATLSQENEAVTLALRGGDYAPSRRSKAHQ